MLLLYEKKISKNFVSDDILVKAYIVRLMNKREKKKKKNYSPKSIDDTL